MPKSKKKNLIDDCFTVESRKWGTFVSLDNDGNPIVTSMTEEACVNATRWFLKAKQEGLTEHTKTYDGVVGGKL